MTETKNPRHSPEAEYAVIGSLMLDPSRVYDVQAIIVGHEDFYSLKSGTVYKAVTETIESTGTCDMVQLNQWFSDRKLLESVGGIDGLIEYFESVPSASNAEHYARIVRDKSARRAIETAANKAQLRCEGGDSNEDIIKDLDIEISDLGAAASSDADQIGVVAAESISLFIQHGGDAGGVATGFSEIDSMTGGMRDGELTIIAARPSMGKTAFATNIAEDMAIERNIPVIFFSLEMDSRSLTNRILCGRSNVGSYLIRNQKLRPEHIDKLAKAAEEVESSPLLICDNPGSTIEHIVADSRRAAKKHGVKAIFIDYLQLIPRRGKMSANEEVGAISRRLKLLARELDLPVICLSQLSRANEKRDDKRPLMSDLRDSGGIEQDADVIMMIHREDYYKRNDEFAESDGTAEVIIRKQRNGPTGTVSLKFDGDRTRFTNILF